MGRDTLHYTRLLQASSSLAFEHLGDGASTSLGNLLQCLTTFTVKNFFLMFHLNLPSDGKWLDEHLNQVTRYPWMNPVQPHRFVSKSCSRSRERNISPWKKGASFFSPSLSSVSRGNLVNSFWQAMLQMLQTVFIAEISEEGKVTAFL